jgi:hypothetical protein
MEEVYMKMGYKMETEKVVALSFAVAQLAPSFPPTVSDTLAINFRIGI